MYIHHQCIVRVSKVVAHDEHTSVMFGCSDHFFWECIPSNNVDFYRGTGPDTVDRCMSSIHVYRTFREAFWDGYTECIEHATVDSNLFSTDFTLAVYQLHRSDTRPRHYTRYTLGSIKSFMTYNEQLRINPIVGAFCRCRGDIAPADIAYNLCFMCLQSTLELKALSLVGVTEHFSYEVNFKEGFLADLQPGVRNTQVYFLAQSLFESTIAISVKQGTGYNNPWSPRRVSWKKLIKRAKNNSFCILCNKPGNGFDLFVCSGCSKFKLL